jgi:hypothetical protein
MSVEQEEENVDADDEGSEESGDGTGDEQDDGPELPSDDSDVPDGDDDTDGLPPGDGDGDGDGDDDSSALDEVCTPSFELELTDQDPERVSMFVDAMDGDPEATAQAIGRAVCKVLYRAPEEVRDATHLTLLIEHAVGDVAWKAGDGGDITVMISTDHMQNVANEGRDVAEEIKGVLFHEMTHMYQHDDSDGGGVDIGLIEGIADFVRISAGYPPHRSQPNPNGNWDSGYTTTAYFLLWVDEQYEDFVYQLNLSMSNKDQMTWSPDSFRTITGKSADELWSDYVDSF